MSELAKIMLGSVLGVACMLGIGVVNRLWLRQREGALLRAFAARHGWTVDAFGFKKRVLRGLWEGRVMTLTDELWRRPGYFCETPVRNLPEGMGLFDPERLERRDGARFVIVAEGGEAEERARAWLARQRGPAKLMNEKNLRWLTTKGHLSHLRMRRFANLEEVEAFVARTDALARQVECDSPAAAGASAGGAV